ncbi:MAG: hypothetical protein HQL49_06775 [Gammaproteobacteria bacterium]|nr:hypothetical protein [Gammaproteobacteria bacterium]
MMSDNPKEQHSAGSDGGDGDNFPRHLSPRIRRLLVLLIIVAGVMAYTFWSHVAHEAPDHVLHNALLGRLPKPTEPPLFAPLQELLQSEPTFTYMTVTHIPEITMGARMPHPFVGACINCHLIKDGAAAGSQFKTPYGAALEQFSKYVFKPGPNITPQSERPHPPAGRCIKCHDLVVKVPVERSYFKWL